MGKESGQEVYDGRCKISERIHQGLKNVYEHGSDEPQENRGDDIC